MITPHNTRNARCTTAVPHHHHHPHYPASHLPRSRNLHLSISTSWGFSLTRYWRVRRKGGQEDYSLKSECFHILQRLKQEHVVIWESCWDSGTLPVLHPDQCVLLCILYFHSFVPFQERGQGGLLVVDLLLLHARSVPVLSNWYGIVYLTVLPPVMELYLSQNTCHPSSRDSGDVFSQHKAGIFHWLFWKLWIHDKNAHSLDLGNALEQGDRWGFLHSP